MYSVLCVYNLVTQYVDLQHVCMYSVLCVYNLVTQYFDLRHVCMYSVLCVYNLVTQHVDFITCMYVQCIMCVQSNMLTYDMYVCTVYYVCTIL